MYVFGGVYSCEENKRTSDLLRIWLKIPKLQKICWEAVCHHFPHLPDLSPTQLLKIGIPISTVNNLHYQTPAYG